MKSFVVQDDGHGIRKEDLPILCERHTTSKLSTFEDIRSIGTFGFRGEALASISHVANVTVTTKTAVEACGYRATYSLGQLEGGKAPKPCACNPGTIIQADNLFYNFKQRREALKNPSEEFKKIIHVVQRYALHYSGKSFSLKKQNSNNPEVFTQKDASIESNIGMLFGSDLAKEILTLSCKNEDFGLEAEGKVSSVNYGSKKSFMFILFINHRLVESSSLKKMVKDVYSRVLSKGKSGFVYLSLSLNPVNVDVNVHPTKLLVRFRHEEQIVSKIEEGIILNFASFSLFIVIACFVGIALEEVLASSNQSRSFKVTSQSKLNDSILSASSKGVREYKGGDAYEPWNQVRVDSREQKMEAFLVPRQRQAGHIMDLRRGEREEGEEEGGEREEDDELETIGRRRSRGDDFESQASQMQPKPLAKKLKRHNTLLSSVLHLRDEIESNKHVGLSQLFEEHTFVGFVDCNKALIQHRLKLYLVDIHSVSKEFFYEQVLEGFQGFRPMKLSKSPNIRDLLKLQLESLKGATRKFSDLSEEEQTELMETLLKPLNEKRRKMLKLYFSIDISDDMHLLALPELLKNFTPDWMMLPRFLLNLVSKVSYANEMECFRMIANELALFYAPSVLNDKKLGEKERKDRYHSIQYVLFDGMKLNDFSPPNHLPGDKDIVLLASVDNLYKTFERC